MAKNTNTAAVDAASNIIKNAEMTASKLAVSKAEAAPITTSTKQEEKKPADTSGVSYIQVACLMQNGISFRGLKTTKDGSFTFPGINHDCRGPQGGVLALPGNAVCVAVPSDVWEEIKTTRSNHYVFRHDPPYLIEAGTVQDFNARMHAGEFMAVKTGAEPFPQSFGLRTI